MLLGDETMLKVLKNVFDNEYKELKRFRVIADKIDALDEEMSKLSDKKLASYTDKFKKELENGSTLEDILVEAFAVAREAASRTVGMKPFYCQLLGGLAIHYGNIAEMKTGEGKTLTCVLPAYLNALTGKGVHIVTVNEFLSTRDSEWMGEVFRFLGLTVGLNLRELIHLANLRLCTRAQLEIRTVVQQMVKLVVEREPWLAEHLVPKCQRLGYCDEDNSCGRMKTKNG